jgi:hypothetical protein
MFANSGEITAPWGVPLSAATLHPTSTTPALSHLRIGHIIRQSAIRRSRIVITVVMGFFRSVEKRERGGCLPQRLPHGLWKEKRVSSLLS